jgi:hypothetical protein
VLDRPAPSADLVLLRHDLLILAELGKGVLNRLRTPLAPLGLRHASTRHPPHKQIVIGLIRRCPQAKLIGPDQDFSFVLLGGTNIARPQTGMVPHLGG